MSATALGTSTNGVRCVRWSAALVSLVVDGKHSRTQQRPVLHTARTAYLNPYSPWCIELGAGRWMLESFDDYYIRVVLLRRRGPRTLSRAVDKTSSRENIFPISPQVSELSFHRLHTPRRHVRKCYVITAESSPMTKQVDKFEEMDVLRSARSGLVGVPCSKTL